MGSQSRSEGLRVAIVCPEFRTEFGGEGGLATSVDFALTVARDRGWQTDVFSPRMSRRAPESRRLLKPSSWLKRIRIVRRPDGAINVGAHLAELEVMRYMPRKAFDEILDRYDVVVFIAGSPAAATMTRRLKTPVVLAAATLVEVERVRALEDAVGLSRHLTRTMTTFVSRMDRAAVRYPTHVLVLNGWMQRMCVDAGAKAVTVAPPGVETNRFVPLSEYQANGPIVMVARLADPRKDYPTLFRAYAGAREMGLTTPLVVAGRGRLSESDSLVLADLGLAEFVSVRSDIDGDELVALLQSASLFVSSSAEEGLGLSIVEAMACGVPVVSTATEGAQHVLGTSGVGELVPVGDAQRLAQALTEWIASPERRKDCATEARRRAVEVFSVEATSRRFGDIIEAAARFTDADR